MRGGLTGRRWEYKLILIMDSDRFRTQARDDLGAFVRRLQEAGLKVTGPRLAILTALDKDVSHPSADQIYADLRPRHPSLSLSTVYKTLEAFTRAGLCRRLNGIGQMHRFDGTNHAHHHAVCRECGHIDDLPADTFPGTAELSRLPEGMTVHGVHVEFEVTCAACTADRPAKGGGYPAPPKTNP